jgi:hypothetical protein
VSQGRRANLDFSWLSDVGVQVELAYPPRNFWHTLVAFLTFLTFWRFIESARYVFSMRPPMFAAYIPLLARRRRHHGDVRTTMMYGDVVTEETTQAASKLAPLALNGSQNGSQPS